MLEGREPSVGHTQIVPGMDVCDVSGEKVGSVARVYHGVAASDIVEVKTGPFGLGKHLYVPPEEVDGVTDAGLILKHPKQEFHEAGLDARPDDLKV